MANYNFRQPFWQGVKLLRRDGAGLRCDGGCGRSIKRGGWWACGGCDYDVCTSCYEEEVGGA